MQSKQTTSPTNGLLEIIEDFLETEQAVLLYMYFRFRSGPHCKFTTVTQHKITSWTTALITICLPFSPETFVVEALVRKQSVLSS